MHVLILGGPDLGIGQNICGMCDLSNKFPLSPGKEFYDIKDLMMNSANIYLEELKAKAQ